MLAILTSPSLGNPRLYHIPAMRGLKSKAVASVLIMMIGKYDQQGFLFKVLFIYL